MGELILHLVRMHRTCFDQLLCHELQKGGNSRNGQDSVLENPRDMCGLYTGQPGKVTKSGYFIKS